MRASLAPIIGLWVLLSACGDAETDSRHDVTRGDAGVLFESRWRYRSFEVDVDLWLGTDEREGNCSTTASLSVNSVIAATDRYGLEPTDCSVLRLTEAGDIVLFESPTGYAWQDQALSVDTDDETIELGPVTSADPETGHDVTYRFRLWAPPCPDDDDCDCGALLCFADSTRLELPLGRSCD